MGSISKQDERARPREAAVRDDWCWRTFGSCADGGLRHVYIRLRLILAVQIISKLAEMS